MEYNINNVTECEREIEITVTAEELLPHFEKAYEKYRPKIEIKGFRKGKAPLDMIKKLYGESIEYESLDQVAGEVYYQVVKDQNLNPVGEPALVDLDYKRGHSLRFKIKYEVKPEFELKAYKGIHAEKSVHRVTEKEIEAEIDRLRHINSTTREVDTVTDDEHILLADLQELDQTGLPVIGKKNENARIYLAEENLYPEIRQALQDAKVGNDYRVQFETKHEKPTHKTNLLIKIKKIEKVELPEFTDEFVKKITKEKVSAVDEFRKQLRQDLEDFWAERSERQVIEAICGEVIKRHDISVPESLVRAFLDSFVQEIKNQQPNKKPPPNFNEKEFRKENRAYAIRQAKWMLIREKILENENLKVEETDLERLAETESKKIGIEKDRLLNYYKTSQAANERILSDKLMKFLKDHAVTQEKVTEEVFD